MPGSAYKRVIVAAALSCLITVIVLSCAFCVYYATYEPLTLKSRMRISNRPCNGSGRLFVRGMWGLANHLRTYNVAYDLAQELGRKLVIVNNRDFAFYQVDFADFGTLDLDDVQFISADELDGIISENHKVVEYNQEDCTMYNSASQWNDINHYDDILIHACGLIPYDGLPITDRFYKALMPNDKVNSIIKPVMDRINECRENGQQVIGVHIRQGSIKDYETGYFFGPWDNSKKHVPALCCFDDTTKNACSCPDAAPGIEGFHRAMKNHKNVVYFVCSDRPGCVLYLEQEYSGKLIYNPNALRIEHDVDTVSAFCDWYCLSQCDHLILTNVSSFSTEAIRYRGENDITYEAI